MCATLYVVATPIGNLEDITARALRTLREVAVIAAEDTRRTAHLLAHYGIPTPTTSLHAHNEYRKAELLLSRLRKGEDVALVSDAGTPTVSDPGQRLIRAAAEEHIRIEPIPGPSAVLAALSASGFSADTFSFLGFPPIRSSDRVRWFDRLKDTDGTVVFFEAPHRIRRTLEELLRNLGDIKICVARELTKRHEELVIQPISAVLKTLKSSLGEFTVVASIGHTTEKILNEPPSAAAIKAEFGVLTNNMSYTRRKAIKCLAEKYNLPQRDIYSTLEAAKN